MCNYHVLLFLLHPQFLCYLRPSAAGGISVQNGFNSDSVASKPHDPGLLFTRHWNKTWFPEYSRQNCVTIILRENKLSGTIHTCLWAGFIAEITDLVIIGMYSSSNGRTIRYLEGLGLELRRFQSSV